MDSGAQHRRYVLSHILSLLTDFVRSPARHNGPCRVNQAHLAEPSAEWEGISHRMRMIGPKGKFLLKPLDDTSIVSCSARRCLPEHGRV